MVERWDIIQAEAQQHRIVREQNILSFRALADIRIMIWWDLISDPNNCVSCHATHTWWEVQLFGIGDQSQLCYYFNGNYNRGQGPCQLSRENSLLLQQTAGSSSKGVQTGHQAQMETPRCAWGAMGQEAVGLWGTKPRRAVWPCIIQEEDLLREKGFRRQAGRHPIFQESWDERASREVWLMGTLTQSWKDF